MPRVGPLRYGELCPLHEVRSIPFTNLKMWAGWITPCQPAPVGQDQRHSNSNRHLSEPMKR
jgi:hypothetical protein